MTVNYCTSANIAAYGGFNVTGADFSASTQPTKVQVEEFINMNEAIIDMETGHAWRTITVNNEYRDVKYPWDQWNGTPIHLAHRAITTFASGTDKLEIWDGNSWIDFVATKSEGRNGDYWVDYEQGIVYIRSGFSWGSKRVRVTYRYGESIVPADIKKACVLLTVADLLVSDDRSNQLPAGGDNIPMIDKSRRLRSEAYEIITRRAEFQMIQS